MKTMEVQVLSAIVLAIGTMADAQGTFQDLNFEEANIVPIPGQPYTVTVANALPGWTVDYGTIQQSQITYNDPSLGGTAATLLANGYPTLTGETPLDGNFSILLYGGAVGGVRTPVSIGQTGVIPAGTQSLLFDGAWFSGGPPPDVSIGNDNLTLFPVGSGIGEGGQNYIVYGANISAFAGQTEQLSFTAPGGYGSYSIDDISFSPGVVPEPSAMVLTVIGGLLFALYRRFASKQ